MTVVATLVLLGAQVAALALRWGHRRDGGYDARQRLLAVYGLLAAMGPPP